MEQIKKRLDHLKAEIQEDDFLLGNGLSNEANIHIFCYEPKDEMIVRHFTDQLITDTSLKCHPIVRNLYDIFLKICADIDILDAVSEMEAADGSEYLLEQIHSTVGTGEFIEQLRYGKHQPGDVLILAGVGAVFPFMRVHKLLEAMQPHFPDTPILVLYPGNFDGYHLRLFNLLQPSDYYRAFNMI